MSKRLLWKDGGAEYWIEHDSGKHTICRVEDVTPALDNNKRLRNDTSYARQGYKDGYQHIGFIPNLVLEMWYHKGLIKHPLLMAEGDTDRARALLNSREYSYLKTYAGSV